jgi:protein ImuB
MSHAVLHVADFALQAVVRTRADLAGKPVALLDDRGRKAVVVQTNAPARAAGVTAGLSATQAMARCADIVLLPRSRAAEKDAEAALMTVAATLSPRVERTAGGICTVDLAGKAADTHLPHTRAAVEQLQSLGLDATAGIARTPFLALTAARVAGVMQSGVGPDPFRQAQGPEPVEGLASGPAESGDRKPEAEKGNHGPPASGDPTATPENREIGKPGNGGPRILLRQACGGQARRAPTGSENAGPDSESETGASRLHEISRSAGSVLAVQDECGFLSPLPLALVEPPPDLAAILDGWGIRTLGALTALPKPEVGLRLGQAGIDLWERAAGEVDRPIEPCAPEATFSADMDLEHEVETLEPLLFILRRFVDRLALQLAQANLVAAELALELLLVDETTYQRGFRLPEPAGSPDLLFRALQTHLESLHTESSIRGVRLAITPTRPLVRQHGLFDTGLRDPHGFAETLARVEAVVGRDRVGTPALEPTHRSDAFFLEKPVDVVGPLPPLPILPQLGLPLRRFRPPVEAQVATGPHGPVSVRCCIVHGEVARQRGPWRTSGEWWKPGRWAAEEWDIELTCGGLFRLSLRDEQWRVEGMYD